MLNELKKFVKDVASKENKKEFNLSKLVKVKGNNTTSTVFTNIQDGANYTQEVISASHPVLKKQYVLVPHIKEYQILEHKIELEFEPFGDVKIIIRKKKGFIYEEISYLLSSKGDFFANKTIELNGFNGYFAEVTYFQKEEF